VISVFKVSERKNDKERAEAIRVVKRVKRVKLGIRNALDWTRSAELGEKLKQK
jgi:hypothetical protein